MEYGVVVWVSATPKDQPVDPCYVTEPRFKIVSSYEDTIEFLKQFTEPCRIKVYRIAGDSDLDDFCEEIDYQHPACENLLEKDSETFDEPEDMFDGDEEEEEW